MADITVMRTPAETALVAGSSRPRKAELPGDAGAARAGVRASSTARPAASPGRGVQIHRPARAHARERPRSRRSRRRRTPPRRWRPGDARFADVDAVRARARQRPCRRARQSDARRGCRKASRSCRSPRRWPPATDCSPASARSPAARDNAGLPAQRGLHGRRRDDRASLRRSVEKPVHLRFVTAGAAPSRPRRACSSWSRRARP